MKTYYEEYDMIDFARKRRFTQTIQSRTKKENSKCITQTLRIGKRKEKHIFILVGKMKNKKAKRISCVVVAVIAFLLLLLFLGSCGRRLHDKRCPAYSEVKSP